ncbi:chaoptin [Condylostylus longicornis]|uniref:chaoptin n=1 Tax=Condylostylus longicornis TaxID=2530218 RepID=UPI00244E12DB|nr:chaoptin [Condylostylus longicornis]
MKFAMFLLFRYLIENNRPNLIIISISMMYCIKTTVECWKFDARFASDSGRNGNTGGGGGGGGGPGGGGGNSNVNGNSNTNTGSNNDSPTNNGGGGGGGNGSNNNNHNTSYPNSSSATNKIVPFHPNVQDILFPCELNSMCQCASLPNDTTTLVEINCNSVTLYKFPEFLQSSIRFIEITRSHLQSVDEETFQGLRLETLKLIENKLQDIAERSFSTMTHTLLTLDLTGNQLQHIQLQALNNLHVLTRLVAQRNYITTLDGNWGSLCDSLRSIHLSGNQIYELTLLNGESLLSGSSSSSLASSSALLSANNNNNNNNNLISGVGPSPILTSSSLINTNQIIRPFSKLRKLIWLDLSNNRIYHISETYLPRSLLTIDLTKNLLTIFPHHLFGHLHDLRIISLRDNLIRMLFNNNLNSFININKNSQLIRIHLEKLDLGMNLIDELRTDWFQNSQTDVRIKALNLEKNYIKSLPSSTFTGIGIIHLVLAFNEIERIHIDAFDGILNTLEYLDLERNRLQSVPGAIKKLNKLKYLYLTANQIAHLSNLPEIPYNLRVLSISGNNFTTIPIDILKNYTELSYLNIGYNMIADIPELAFLNWGSHLQTILLRNNKITSLQYNSFAGLDSIKEISLSFNDIVYTNPYVFENVSKTLKILELSFAMYRDEFPMEALSPLTELMWLGLDNNNLKLIKNESLSTMHELTYINLSFNQICQILNGLFNGDIHKHLIEIDMSYNLIENLTSKTFDNLEKLQILNLQSNKINIIERHSFFNLPYLKYIDLSHNKLYNISESAFAFLPSLTELDLTYNLLTKFSLNYFYYVTNSTNLLKLNLSHNEIIDFNDILISYLYINELDISYNLITNTNCFSNLGNYIKIINLKSNNIKLLGNHAFGDLKYLEILNLSNNNITSIRRRSFQGLNSLQILDLSLNNIEQLQAEQFSNLKKLRILNLNNNRLRALPREVFMNTRLEYLDISYNQLSVWPVPAFSDIGFTLRSIQFMENNLEYLDSNMFINSQFLFDLNLSRNKITVLPDNTFMFLNNLTNLDLSYNPLVTSNLKQVFLHTPRIKYLNLQGVNLFELPELELPYLTNLDISNNHLQELLKLNELYNLRKINVSYNNVINMSNIVEQLPINSIKILDISNNPLRRITIFDMQLLRNIDELYMMDIKITNPQIFSKLKIIKKLSITSSQYFGDIISKLLSLQELYVNINDNDIDKELFSKLINNTKLNLIEINGKNVNTIHSQAFEGLSRIHNLKLRLRNTEISDLPPSIFYPLKSISHLTIDISDNKITALAADSFYPNISYWDSVGTRNIIGGIDTANNPLECECGLVWFGHWLRRWLRESAQIKVIGSIELKQMVQRARANFCVDPITGKRQPILEIFPEDLMCHASALSSSSRKAETNIILILFILLTDIIIIFNYYFHYNYSLILL